MSNNILQSVKQHLRFSSAKGDLTTEQLFELPLTSKSGFDLDSVARAANAALKEAGEESFVTASNPARAVLALKLEVVKEVIADRQADHAAKLDLLAKAQRREQLLEVKASHQADALKNMTPEQVDAELAKLG